jgi:hypothetical protein
LNRILYVTAAIALGGLMAVLHATPIGKIGGSALPNSHLPELEYLKSVNRVGPPQDPQLMEKTQNTDPFKFILYSGKIGEQVPQMGDHAEEPRGRSAARP